MPWDKNVLHYHDKPFRMPSVTQRLKDTDLTSINSVENWELKSNDEEDGGESIPNKVNSRCFKIHRSYIPCSSCQMLVFSGVEFQRTVSKLKKLLSCVHALHETWNQTVSRRVLVTTAKKRTKRVMHGKRFFFALIILTYRAFSHDSTGRRPYAAQSLGIRRRKGKVGEEGKKGRRISLSPTVILRMPRLLSICLKPGC